MTRDDDGRRRGPRELRDDVDEELGFHLEMRAAELEQQGFRPDEARAEALRRFGDRDATAAGCVESDRRRQRNEVRRAFLRDLAHDLRFALRRVRRRPFIAAVVAATLGLGIGAVTAIFSVADHVLLRPLPIADESRVVTLWERGAHETQRRVSPGNFLFWRDHASAFSAMGLAEPSGYDLTGADARPESIGAWRVSDGFFAALGVRPEIGRLPRPEDHDNPTAERRRARATELAGALAAVPGVTDVAAVTALPFHPHSLDGMDELAIEGSAAPRRRVHTTLASPGYFRVLGIPLVAGRGFDEGRDGPSAERVAVVNQSLARALFPGVDPIGQRVRFAATGDAEVCQIVGVVGDVRPTSLASEPRPELFLPLAQGDTRGLIFVVRVAGSSAAVARALPALREAVWQVDPAQSIFHSGVVEDLVSGTLVDRRFNLGIVTGLSLLALVLAAAGVATLVSYETRLRTHELGVRMALGARPHQVVAGAMWDGLVAVLPGLVVGLAGAAAAARGLGGMLYRIDALDPLTFVVIGAGTLGVAALAAFLPARRAARVDPLEAMRG